MNKIKKNSKPTMYRDYFVEGMDFEREISDKIISYNPNATNDQLNDLFFGVLSSVFGRLEKEFKKKYILDYLKGMPTEEDFDYSDCKINTDVKTNTSLN